MSIDMDNANITTSYIQADQKNWDNVLILAIEKYEANFEQPMIPARLGCFSAGAGTAELTSRRKKIDSWVILAISANDLGRAAADLLMAWKTAESLVPHSLAEFKISAWKGASKIHGILEINEYLGDGMHELGAPLRTAANVMNAMAKYLEEQGYECPPP